MKCTILALSVLLLCGCGATDSMQNILSGRRHTEMTIRTQKPWEIYGIKECMVLTGRPLVEGGKVQPDPHEMVCADDAENTSEYKFEMPHMTVDLDKKAQAEFEDEKEKKWGVPVSCTKSAETHFECELSERN